MFILRTFPNFDYCHSSFKKCVKIICLFLSKQNCAQDYGNALIYELFTLANLLTDCFANMPPHIWANTFGIYLTDDFCNFFVHFCITFSFALRRLLSRPQIV